MNLSISIICFLITVILAAAAVYYARRHALCPWSGNSLWWGVLFMSVVIMLVQVLEVIGVCSPFWSPFCAVLMAALAGIAYRRDYAGRAFDRGVQQLYNEMKDDPEVIAQLYKRNNPRTS